MLFISAVCVNFAVFFYLGDLNHMVVVSFLYFKSFSESDV